MNKKKETRAKLQIIFSIIIFAIVMNAQLYTMINFAEEYLSIAILTVLLLICLYFILSSIFTFKSLNDQKNEERYDTIFKSEKASYLLLKKYFEEIDSKLDILQSISKVPTEEIVNTQKGIAKVVINRSRENAEALMNSNDQLLDRISNFEEKMDSNNEMLLDGQKNVMNNSLSDIVEKQQQLIESIKDMEIRLSQAIANNPVQFNANVEIPAQAIPNVSNIQPQPANISNEPEIKPEPAGIPNEPEIEAEPVEIPNEPKITPEPVEIPNEPEITPEPAEIPNEPEIKPEPAEIPNEPEITPEPADMSDEIENAEPVDLSSYETEPVNEPVEMADEIEEVIEPQEEAQFEDVVADVEAEPVSEPEAAISTDEPAAPSMPMDDPNRQLTPDEIAALIASM